MRNVRNRQAVKRLAAKSFRANRTRNTIAVIAIALTALLFTAVFTIGLGMIEDTQRSAMLQAGGDAHGAIKNITEEQYEILKQHPSIVECGRDMSVSYGIDNPEFLKRHVEMHYIEKNIYPHWFIDITDGKAPETADEILLDQTSLELLGLEAKAGCTVELLLRIHPDDKPVKRTFTVSGVIKPAQGMNVGFAIVSEAYAIQYKEEMNAKGPEYYDGVGQLSMHVLFSNSMNIQKKLDRIITDSGFSLDEGSPDYIESNANWAYMSDGAESDPMTLIGLGSALLLILTTGYLIIYNIFHISVIRDIRFYGLLKTIGTTERQIRRILRRQAFRLWLFGTPAGLLLGFFTGKFLLPLMLDISRLEGPTITAVSPHPWIFIGGALFTVITVLISEQKPARIAAKVSPVEALRYTEQSGKRKRLKKTTDGGKITRMAFSNLGRNRGRTAVVICSLSLTVILMNSLYTVTSSIDRDGFLSKMILCEDVIGSAALWNYDYRPFDEETAAEESLSESFISACESQESFDDGGRIYMTPNHVRLPVESWEIPDHVLKDESGAPGRETPAGFEPYAGYETGGYFAALHGIEPFVLSKMTVVEGETDKDALWEKLQTGNYMIYGVQVDDNNFVMESDVKHRAGDTITLRYENGDTKKYEIAAVVKGHSFSLTNRMINDFAYYVSAGEFKEHLSDAYLMNFLMDTKEGQAGAMEEFLKSYTSDVEPLMSYESRTMYAGTYDQILGIITLVGSLLTAMIGFIGLLNFINIILTGMETRKREFAMMEAIGMTRRQLVGMLTAEGLYYAALTLIFSLAAATLFSLTALRALGDGIWFVNYRFTLLPVLIVCPLLLLLGAWTPRIVYRLRKQESIVEEIRE
jgi:putative ABC transport system permease protein